MLVPKYIALDSKSEATCAWRCRLEKFYKRYEAAVAPPRKRQ